MKMLRKQPALYFYGDIQWRRNLMNFFQLFLFSCRAFHFCPLSIQFFLRYLILSLALFVFLDILSFSNLLKCKNECNCLVLCPVWLVLGLIPLLHWCFYLRLACFGNRLSNLFNFCHCGKQYQDFLFGLYYYCMYESWSLQNSNLSKLGINKNKIVEHWEYLSTVIIK